VSIRRSGQAVALALALAVVLSSCGGGGGGARGSDTARVKQTVRRALADLATGDGDGFCGLVTPAGRHTLATTLPGYTCAGLVNLVSGHLSQAERSGLRNAQVRAVTVTGSIATVKASDITAGQGTLSGLISSGGRPTRLERQPDGGWRITG
jgi:hypothetical protein